jgi:hypothetical protein
VLNERFKLGKVGTATFESYNSYDFVTGFWSDLRM